MKIIVDERERALYDRLDARLSSLKTPSFAILEKRVLPLGDILLETDEGKKVMLIERKTCLLYTSPSPRDQRGSRMPSSA